MPSEQVSVEAKAPAFAWTTLLFASLFFFYEFMQMNVINSIGPALLMDFHINATRLAMLSDAYLLANVFFLFPAGMILDRFSTRRIILTALALCFVGTFLLSLAPTVWWAMAARFLTGIGGAFCLLSCMRLATRWFPQSMMARVTGFIVLIAFMGGFAAQAPSTFLLQHVSWRSLLQILSLVGLLIWLTIFVFVRDYPQGQKHTAEQQVKDVKRMGFLCSVKQALKQRYNWLAGGFVFFMNVPISLFGMTWGVLYLTSAQHVTHMQAAEVTSMLFWGSMLGCPLLGYLSDRLHQRKAMTLLGAVVSLLVVGALFYTGVHGLMVLMLLFFVLGFTTSTQVLAYPVITEKAPKMIAGMCLSIGSVIIMGGQLIMQFLFGLFTDLHAHSLMHAQAHFAASDFHLAMLLVPASFIAALLLAQVLPPEEV